MSTADFITILTGKGHRRATKLIEWNTKLGQVDIRSYDNMKLYSGEERLVSSVHELHDLLTGIEHNFSSHIIKGKIADGVDRNRMVRRVRDKHDGIDPTLLPADHHWIALDLDAIPCPEYIEPEREPKAAVEYMIEQLPPEFHDRTCRWQFTSSQGFKGNTISLRLYFWADRPLSNSDLKTWLCACEPRTKIRRWPMIDAAVFAPAQPIYTAAPMVEISAPELATEHRHTGYSGHSGGTQAPGAPGLGYEGHCARIGDHEAGDGFFRPIKSAVAAYIGRHGSRVDAAWLREDLEQVIRRAPRDRTKHSDAYVEIRVEDLDRLIPAIVDMERAGEEAAKVAAETPEDPDAPDELAVLIDQHWDEAVTWARQNIPGCTL